MKKVVLFLVLGLLGLSALAQNPYVTQTVDNWKIVQDVRAAFKISTRPGIGVPDLKALEIFLSNRQLASIYNALAAKALSTGSQLNAVKLTTLQELSGTKHLGPTSLAIILIFHSFTDEATVAPVVLK